MTHNDNYPPGYAVDPELLLEYLIEKTDQFAHGTWSGFPLSFQVCGASLLKPLPDLWKEFMKVLSASDEPVNERAKRFKDVLLQALPRLPECDFKDPDGEMPEVDRFSAARFLRAAQQDAEDMLKRDDFRYISIWEFLVRIGLRGDLEKLDDFQETCLRYPNPADRIEALAPVLRETIRALMNRHQG